jgi:hypothetical protein
MSTFAVKVIDNSDNVAGTPANTGAQTVAGTIITFGVMAILGLCFFIIFAFILMKIWTKLTEYDRGKNDFLYEHFELLANQSHISHDTKFKKRNWKLIWIFWKRQPVFIQKSSGKVERIGDYHGETDKKENFYILAIQNKLGMFQYINQIIFIPMTIKDKVLKKVNINGQNVIYLDCEGIDNIENSYYFYIPLIKNPKNNKEYVDFSNKVHKEYIENVVLKDMVKENLLSSRKMVVQSVETNPYIHFGRRGGKNWEK